MCFLLLFTRSLPLVSVSWDVFSRPSVCSGVFSLVFLALVSVGLRPVSVWSCFWASCPFGCWGSRFSLPLVVSRLTTLSLFLSVPRFLLDWMVCPPSSSVVFHRLLLFIGLLWVGRPVLFLCSVSLFLVCSWGLCSPSFPPSRLWSSRLALSFCRCAPGLLFASGRMFLPSLTSWSVGSPGSPRLGVPLCSGGLFPGLSLFCIFGCIGSAPFLPSSPAPPVSYDLVVVLSHRWAPPLRVYWLSHPTMVHCGFVICCLSPI